MRVLEKGKLKVYRVHCIGCGSLLEIEPKDLSLFGFCYCPVCCKTITPMVSQLVDKEESNITTECLQDTK